MNRIKRFILKGYKPNKPIRLLRNSLSRDQFLILGGVLVGISAGIAAAILKNIVLFLHSLTEYFSSDIPVFIWPLAGIPLTVWVIHVFFKGNDGRGIGNILYDITRRSSLMKRSKIYTQIISSGMTIGLGGSAGLESPIAITGSAIGSNFGRAYGFNYKDRTLLLAAGAAGGIAAAFNAPIAGVMFAIEILLKGASVAEFIPLIIASVFGALCTKIIFHEDTLFHFIALETFDYTNVPFYIILGIYCGGLSLYYLNVSERIENWFHSKKNTPYLRALIGGGLLVVLCAFFPSLIGEGYSSIKILANGNASSLFTKGIFSNWSHYEIAVWLLIGFIGLLKVFAASITIASGGSGGNFAPSLFMGAYVGYFFSKGFNLMDFDLKLPVGNLTLVGMAGILSGVLYAPLTAIFLIAELSGGYALMIPLMIVSAFSHLIVKSVHPVSPELKKTTESNPFFTKDQGRYLLTSIKIAELVDGSAPTLTPNATLRTLVILFTQEKKTYYAVVDENNQLRGMLYLEDVRKYLFEEKLYDTLSIAELMQTNTQTIFLYETMESILNKFDQEKKWHLPVIHHETFIGCISKSAILNNYRKELTRYLDKPS